MIAIVAAAWIFSGLVFGYVYSIVICSEDMTVADIILSALAGPLCLFEIAWKKKSIIVFRVSKTALDPKAQKIADQAALIAEQKAKLAAILSENKDLMDRVMKLSRPIEITEFMGRSVTELNKIIEFYESTKPRRVSPVVQEATA